jgi:hypothetical protein
VTGVQTCALPISAYTAWRALGNEARADLHLGWLLAALPTLPASALTGIEDLFTKLGEDPAAERLRAGIRARGDTSGDQPRER